MFTVEPGTTKGQDVSLLGPGRGHLQELGAGDAVGNPEDNTHPVWVSFLRDGLELAGPAMPHEGQPMLWAMVMLLPGWRVTTASRAVGMIASMAPCVVTVKGKPNA